MSRSHILRYGFVIAFILLAWASRMNSDFKDRQADTTTVAAVIDHPSFSGEPSMNARWEMLNQKYTYLRKKK